MASSLDLLECPVCLEAYVDPQLISACGHTFCRRCVERLYPKRCPSCRAPFKLDGLRPNYALRQMLQDGAPAQAAVSNDGDAIAPQVERRGSGLASLAREHGDCEKAQRRAAERLADLGVPAALARLVSEEDQLIALRFFLLDNSGSTATADGHVLDMEVDSSGNSEPVSMACTRWEEICHMAMKQAEWNAHLGTPCEFVLLNPPSHRPQSEFREGVDFVRIDASAGDVEAQVSALHRMLQRTGPRGPTPIVHRLSEIYDRINSEHHELVVGGQRVVVVIATDGLPTGPYSGRSSDADKKLLVNTLRKLTSDLPVFVVIRLTTDEEEVVEFYNQIDEELELPLEVLDDLESEAKEVAQQGNGWLTYSPLLHTLREGGTFVKLFDLLDERKLNRLEIVLFVRLLLQSTESTLLPCDPEAFCEVLQGRVEAEDLVYDPLRKRMAPVVNVRGVKRAVLPACRWFRLCCRRWSAAKSQRKGAKRGYTHLDKAVPQPIMIPSAAPELNSLGSV